MSFPQYSDAESINSIKGIQSLSKIVEKASPFDPSNLIEDAVAFPPPPGLDSFLHFFTTTMDNFNTSKITMSSKNKAEEVKRHFNIEKIQQEELLRLQNKSNSSNSVKVIEVTKSSPQTSLSNSNVRDPIPTTSAQAQATISLLKPRCAEPKDDRPYSSLQNLTSSSQKISTSKSVSKSNLHNKQPSQKIHNLTSEIASSSLRRKGIKTGSSKYFQDLHKPKMASKQLPSNVVRLACIPKQKNGPINSKTVKLSVPIIDLMSSKKHKSINKNLSLKLPDKCTLKFVELHPQPLTPLEVGGFDYQHECITKKHEKKRIVRKGLMATTKESKDFMKKSKDTRCDNNNFKTVNPTPITKKVIPLNTNPTKTLIENRQAVQCSSKSTTKEPEVCTTNEKNKNLLRNAFSETKPKIPSTKTSKISTTGTKKMKSRIEAQKDQSRPFTRAKSFLSTRNVRDFTRKQTEIARLDETARKNGGLTMEDFEDTFSTDFETKDSSFNFQLPLTTKKPVVTNARVSLEPVVVQKRELSQLTTLKTTPIVSSEKNKVSKTSEARKEIRSVKSHPLPQPLNNEFILPKPIVPSFKASKKTKVVGEAPLTSKTLAAVSVNSAKNSLVSKNPSQKCIEPVLKITRLDASFSIQPINILDHTKPIQVITKEIKTPLKPCKVITGRRFSSSMMNTKSISDIKRFSISNKDQVNISEASDSEHNTHQTKQLSSETFTSENLENDSKSTSNETISKHENELHSLSNQNSVENISHSPSTLSTIDSERVIKDENMNPGEIEAGDTSDDCSHLPIIQKAKNQILTVDLTEVDSRDKLQVVKKCDKIVPKEILQMLLSRVANQCNSYFKTCEETQINDVFSSCVKCPMDIQTIKNNLERGLIVTLEKLERDLTLMFLNSLMAYQPGHELYKEARRKFDLIGNVFKEYHEEKNKLCDPLKSDNEKVAPSNQTLSNSKQSRPHEGFESVTNTTQSRTKRNKRELSPDITDFKTKITKVTNANSVRSRFKFTPKHLQASNIPGPSDNPKSVGHHQ